MGLWPQAKLSSDRWEGALDSSDGGGAIYTLQRYATLILRTTLGVSPQSLARIPHKLPILQTHAPTKKMSPGSVLKPPPSVLHSAMPFDKSRWESGWASWRRWRAALRWGRAGVS